MAFDVEYDVVVCGSGGSGKSAAYVVANESDLSVCVLEKMATTGGSSQYAEGSCASESVEQIARGNNVDYPGGVAPANAHYPTHEEHFKRYRDYSHHRANLDVVRAFVWNSPETIEFYKSLGIEYSDVTIYAYDVDLELYTFHRPEGLGAKCQEVLLRACENAGVDFFVSTPAKELIFDENGEVAGVLATDADGNDMRIGAKAVILATGGFGNNMEMVRKYSWMPWLADSNYTCVPTENTGDGINMALSAGADTRALGTLMVDMVTIGRTLDCHLTGAAFQPNLWLNSRGERFADEGIGVSFADTGNTVAQTDDGTMWSVFDAESHRRIIEDGSVIGLGDFIQYGQQFPRLDAEIEASLEAKDDAAYYADTLDELAELIRVPAETLKATVARYNELCDKGYDEDFFKPAKYLYKVEKGPFYAIHQVPTILVSDGGIRVNGDMQVTDKNYKPIKGLYAVGNEASGLFGDTYNLDCPGTANGFAHTSGRIAGRAAIKALS